MIDTLRVRLSRWGVWREQSVNRRIFAAAVVVGGLTCITNLAAAARELFVAHQFGTSDALDAFLTALVLPAFSVNVIAGSFNAALVPTFIKVREQQGRKAAQRLFSSVMALSTALLLIVSLLLALAGPYLLPFLGSRFTPQKLALTHSLFFALLPSLVISGLSTTWAGILNAGERFALAAATPMILPLVTMLLLVLKGETWGIYALAVGTVGGYLPEAVLLAWSLKRHGFSLIPCWRGMDSDTRQVINQYTSMATSALLMGSTVIVDQAMAATLGSGSVSTLNYGKKVVSFLLGIGSLALSTAVLPHFSRMVAARDWSGVRHTLRTYTFLTVLVTVPFTMVLIYWSQPIVYLLFQRGSFTEADTYLVSRVQTYSFLQIPFYVLGIFGVRLLSALARNQTLLVISGINLVTNVLGNYVFMQFFGVAGISLSTSTVYAIAMLLVFSALFAILKNRETSHQ